MISRESDVAQLLVRNIPTAVKDRLKRRAQRHGRSLEAEVRSILDSAAQAEPIDATGSVQNWVADLSAEMARIGLTQDDIDELNSNIEIATADHTTFKLEDL
jgi:antitoxin FitA